MWTSYVVVCQCFSYASFPLHATAELDCNCSLLGFPLASPQSKFKASHGEDGGGKTPLFDQGNFLL